MSAAAGTYAAHNAGTGRVFQVQGGKVIVYMNKERGWRPTATD
jgi:hypothetical protein